MMFKIISNEISSNTPKHSKIEDKIYKNSYLISITIECNTNEDCTGSSDTCKHNVCYCGPGEEKCFGSCTDGKCRGKYSSI